MSKHTKNSLVTDSVIGTLSIVTGIVKGAIGFACIESGMDMIKAHENVSDIFIGAGFVISGIEISASSLVSCKSAYTYLK